MDEQNISLEAEESPLESTEIVEAKGKVSFILGNQARQIFIALPCLWIPVVS